MNSDATATVSAADPGPVDPAILRTAVVVVHGMGEQLPVETLRQFVRTGLPKHDGARRYFSRPAKVTGSFEARRMLAYRQPAVGQLTHGHTEFFEYHWSYKMTGNKLGDFARLFVRLMLGFWRVPRGLRVLWFLAWVSIIALASLITWTIVEGASNPEWTVAGVVGLLLGQGVAAAVVVKFISALGGVVTDTFVDVARYLDRSPRSYAVRRDIRQGMVDLLRSLHDQGRYSRIIVAAHSLGGYIAYDGITSLWNEMCSPADGADLPRETPPLAHLADVERNARTLADASEDLLELTQESRKEIDAYQASQFELWRDYRSAGNRWLITDFITFGTPMYFADLLYTKNRRQFRQFVHNSELPQCPPRSGDEMVETGDKKIGHRYCYSRNGRQYLAHGSLFAVVRWTNLYFPAVAWFFGDWFGGPLRPLFGNGILDIPVKGNKLKRFTPGAAHGMYFAFPDQDGAGDIAPMVHRTLRLTIDDELLPPPPRRTSD